MTAEPQLELLERIKHDVVGCRSCPRLVSWREQAAIEPPRRFRDQSYWARPVPGFGDPEARIYALGLAPSAHGGNRTGRSFTGNPTAAWLIEALYRAGMANQPTSEHPGDGLALRGIWMGSAVRCAPPQNRPTAEERDRCEPFLRRELAALRNLRVVLALGQFAWLAALRTLSDSPAPRFGHGAEVDVGGLTVLGCYHPSGQNTNTGRLTRAMLDDVVAIALSRSQMRS